MASTDFERLWTPHSHFVRALFYPQEKYESFLSPHGGLPYRE